MMTLNGKRGLIVGIANQHSIAYGCAKVMRSLGAELAVTYLNDKALPYVQPLVQQLECPIIMPLDVADEAQMQALFEAIGLQFGRLDFLVHSIAFAPKADLQGRVTDCSREGFLQAMSISCHSFMALAKLAEPLMPQGGSLMTMSYYGAEKAVPNYAMMGPVKAALEAATRYMAAELGPRNIRVNALSPGPIATRAAGGLSHFDDLLASAAAKAPLRRLIDLEDVGNLAAFLASDLSKSITGGVHYVDCGYEVVS